MESDPQCAARDTSDEGRLGDLENTVRNEQQFRERYMQASERGLDRIVERIEALEGEAAHAWHDVQDGGFSGSLGTLRACLDCGCVVAGGPTRCLRCVRGDNERERQERWHRTRDAALQGFLAGDDGFAGSETYDYRKYVREASYFADCAHGPLEKPVVAAEGIAVDHERRDFETSIRFVDVDGPLASVFVVKKWPDGETRMLKLERCEAIKLARRIIETWDKPDPLGFPDVLHKD